MASRIILASVTAVASLFGTTAALACTGPQCAYVPANPGVVFGSPAR